MKKVLPLLSLVFLFSCANNSSFKGIKYETGEKAEAIKNELVNKLETANVNWVGLEDKAKFDLSLQLDSAASTSSPSTSLKLNLTGSESSKMTFNVSEAQKETPNYGDILKLNSSASINMDIELSTGNSKIEANEKSNVDIMYGVSTLKPSANQNSITSDFLFVKMETTETVNKNKETVKEGILEANVAQQLLQSLSGQLPSIQQDPTTQDQLNQILDLLESSCGFYKEKNSYYLNFSITDFFNSNKQAIISSLGLADLPITLTGNLYAKIEFDDNNNLSGLSFLLDRLSLSYSESGNQIAVLVNLEENIKSFKGEIKAITQKDIDDFGYENINKEVSTNPYL